jgi:CDP-diacylglycerol--glycerol-3-phosphate 3-phosphatidyltransferase
MDLWELIKRGYLRIVAPIADLMVRRRVNPNMLTTLGTLFALVAGGIFAAGHISIAGWVLGLTAVFDVIDGEVARRSGRSTVFGAFYDSSLDRISDGVVLGGILLFFARNGVHHHIPDYMSTPMVAVLLFGIIGSFLTSYTRARAEGLGIDAKVGFLQRPERITMLAAPQAFFGLMLGGWVLMGICTLISVSACLTAVQRIAFVHRATLGLVAQAAEAGRASDAGEPADERRVARTGDVEVAPATGARVLADGARRPGDVPSAPQWDTVR